MSIDINLVNKKTSDSVKDLKLKKIKTISFTILIIIAISSILLFLINLRFSVNYVKSQQNKIIESLSAYDETTSKIFILHQRVEDLSLIISERKKYHDKTELIFKDLSDSITINEFEIDESGVTLGVTSNSLLELDIFLNYLLDLTKTKKLTSIRMTGLSSVDDGSYSMKLILN